MRIVADENIATVIVERLRSGGHGVTSIREFSRGSKDLIVLNLAREQGALLLTGDKDFGELVYRERRSSLGVLLVRLEGLSNSAKANLVNDVIERYGPELCKHFTVITPTSLRFRRLPD